jgi:hypothetical protein
VVTGAIGFYATSKVGRYHPSPRVDPVVSENRLKKIGPSRDDRPGAEKGDSSFNLAIRGGREPVARDAPRAERPSTRRPCSPGYPTSRRNDPTARVDNCIWTGGVRRRSGLWWRRRQLGTG